MVTEQVVTGQVVTGQAATVRLVGRTEFLPPDDVPFVTDGTAGQALAEFAGRACYQSWERRVPSTATNEGYLQHILQVGHLSVLEHSSATFYVTGVSRTAAHEFLRHRHFSYSELSPRYFPAGGGDLVEPAAVAADPLLHSRFVDAAQNATNASAQLLAALEIAAEQAPDGTLARKQARHAAAALLPGATATAFVVTGNYRAWRHFIGMRATEAADIELRTLALIILRLLQKLAPAVFADFRISELPDGTELAASPLVGDG